MLHCGRPFWGEILNRLSQKGLIDESHHHGRGETAQRDIRHRNSAAAKAVKKIRVPRRDRLRPLAKVAIRVAAGPEEC